MEEETEPCRNCKREIPSSNYTIHAVHCTRNIRICPVCKEAMPQMDLEQHHNKMHKLSPCKQCGENVCGTDLEDHIRDSCANTIKSCKFCELELPRRDLPKHEDYCGTRTEQCKDCHEWVMLKYRQLHIVSNHGFVRLDDDPVPKVPNQIQTHTAKNVVVPTNSLNMPVTNKAPAKNVSPKSLLNDNRPGCSGVSQITNGSRKVSRPDRSDPLINNGVKSTQSQDTVDMQNNISLGAVKKRSAPPAPRDLAYYSAQQRRQAELQERQQINMRNSAAGLPPVLTPLEKLERLRKMDAVHNREVKEDYSHKLKGWSTSKAPTGHVVGHNTTVRADLDNLKPMSVEEFRSRFEDIDLEEEEGGRHPGNNQDRFNEIKSSLSKLRRGLNEVTAPYNANNVTNSEQNEARSRSPVNMDQMDDYIKLPCEFCEELVPAEDLVQHQTGCRPDLTQLRPRRSPRRSPHRSPRHSPRRSPRSPRRATPEPSAPVIPCEFCAEALPVYLISQHQEQCIFGPKLTFPD